MITLGLNTDANLQEYPMRCQGEIWLSTQFCGFMDGFYGFEDLIGDLRDDGIAESFESLHAVFLAFRGAW